MVFRLLQENLRIEYVQRSSLFQLSPRTYLSTNSFLALATTATCSHVLGLAHVCGGASQPHPPLQPTHVSQLPRT
jgi:hypothetical protein